MRMPMLAILAIAALDLLAFPARGQSLATVPLVAIDVPVAPIDADAPADAPPMPADATFGPAVAGDALDGLRGGADHTSTTTNISDVDGRVDGNTAINAISGGNLVDGGAFGNAAGLSTVIQNSGNNVLIQNSTVVSVQFVPSP